MKTISNRKIAPDYPRIPHLDSNISQMTHDDILSSGIKFPFTSFVQEKVDGANTGMSWNDGPLVRNRNFLLKKGYSKIYTPAKIQFKSTWNWIHEHEGDIKEVEKRWGGKITIYGEWCIFKHSIFYNKLPDLFLAYDIYSSEDYKFISPQVCKELLKDINIHFIDSSEITFSNIDDIKRESERKSVYTDGYAEGIVLKKVNGYFVDDMYKIVNMFFKRREDFNESEVEKNLIIKS